MSHGVLEQNQIHCCVQLIVTLESISEDLVEIVPGRYGHVFGFSDSFREVTVDQRSDEDLWLRHLVKCFLENVFLGFVKQLNVLQLSQFVLVNSLSLVDPESGHLHRAGDALDGGEEDALEDVAEVSQVEDVVELHRCR